MQYRRSRQAGGSYFFTLVTHSRRKILTDNDALELLRASFRRVKAKRPFLVDAMVVLPDHLHCIWTLPPDDHDFSTRWRLIKSRFSRYYRERRSSGRVHAVSGIECQPVWQNRYWEHLLRDEEDYRRHLDYIHYNPVKHGYTKSPVDWSWSSFRRYVLKGVYTEDWGSSAINLPQDVGRE
ncbi:REP-associated tyrosine transposase [Sedimenticola selenatireducens]|uniref:Transposase n=1 Tax=Sedimenticola selenatireducens TaxID=191960 RepID=A0A2N6CVV3_9GAMM|nr:transposase [Sedimenticola selenatireducens]PLX61328.1 MAG: transposase [Sedimenticola selenatireducens]